MNDDKILQLETKLRFLENQVQHLIQQCMYLDRERIRTKNELNTLAHEVKTRRQ